MGHRVMFAAVVLAAVAAVAAAFAADEERQAFGQHEPRAMSRVVFFSKTGLAGEYAIQYGRPEWRAEYDANFEKITRGKRMRLGKDWWTTLDTFSPLTFGGKTELAEGSWFLALECSEKGDWSLVALDPAPIRKERMDAFLSAKTTGGTLLPMKYETMSEHEKDLSIRFLTPEGSSAEQTLEIRFGKHRLTTSVAAKT